MIFVSATQFHTHFAWCPISVLNVKVLVVTVKTSRRFVGSSISGSIVYTTQTAARSQESGRQNNSSNLGHCLRGGMHHCAPSHNWGAVVSSDLHQNLDYLVFVSDLM